MDKIHFLDRKTPPHIMTLVMAAGLSALTMNIFLPSLPDMAAYFHTDYAVMQFAVSGYLAATAVLQLIIGPLSDLLGRRPVMIGAIVMLLVATLICAFAPNVTIFMIGRILQTGVVAGFVLARAIVRDMVPADEAASMIGYVTMGMSLVPMIGPSIGGALNDMFGWQSNFYALFLLGILVLFLVFSDLGETNRFKAANFTEQFRAWPGLLRSPMFWGYTLTSTCASGVFFSFLGGAPFVGSVIFKLTPAMLGLQFFFVAAGYMAGNFLSGRYARQFGILTMMLSGNIVSIIGIVTAMVLLTSGFDNAYAFFVPLSLIGVGNGMTLPSANAGMVSVRPHLAGSASGVGGAITIGGGAALSVVAAAILTEESGAFPLLAVMLISAFLAIATTEYVRWASRREGMTSAEEQP